MRHKLLQLVLALVLGGGMAMFLAFGAMAFLASSSPAAGSDLLPDLAMTKLRSFQIDTKTISGHTLLRYTTESVNIGAGPLELRGTRPDASTPNMTVVQRVYNDGGGYRDVPAGSYIFWAGDGHSHWHVNDFVSEELDRTDNGVKVGSGSKQGFCLTDSNAYNLALPGAPQSKFYAGCVQGGSTSLGVRTGISVGWGDRYGYRTNLQWVDITGLTPGRYKLVATVDAQTYYLESNQTNNTTWTILQINGNNTVKVVQQGPSV